MDRAFPTSTPSATGTIRTTRRTPMGRVVALAVAAVLVVANPAAAGIDLGVLFDDEPDVNLPLPALAGQLTRTSAHDGWVHVPFSAADTQTLLSGPTFNGAASLPDGRRLAVGTGYGVPGYSGQYIFSDDLRFGLSASGTADGCDFSLLRVESGTAPSSATAAAISFLVGDTVSPGAKLGYVRLTPDESVDGRWLCMYREMRVIEARNSTPKYYDYQRSPVVMMRDPLDIDFEGSRAVEPAAEETTPEPAAEEPTAEEPAPEPEADEAEEAPAEPEADADADADASDEAAAEDTAAEADTTTEDTAAADAEAADGTAGDDATEVTAAADEDATATEDGAADTDGGGALVPTLLGLIALLLVGLLLVLLRGRRGAEPVGAVPAADGSDAQA